MFAHHQVLLEILKLSFISPSKIIAYISNKKIAFIHHFYFILKEWQLPFKEIMILSNEKKCKAIPPMESNYLILKLSKDCTDTMIYLPYFSAVSSLLTGFLIRMLLLEQSRK